MIVTNDIQGGGQLGGLLEVRDVEITSYMSQLDRLANEVVFEVNRLQSSGAGLTPFAANSTLTGTYATETTLSALDYATEIDYSGSFRLWIGDAQGQNMQSITIDLSPLNGNSTLGDLTNRINALVAASPVGGGVTASVSNNAIQLQVNSTNTIAFSNDTSNILAALGLNTFFTGDDGSDIGINSSIANNTTLIAAGRVSPLGEISRGDNSNALDIAALSNQALMNNSTSTFNEFYNALVGTVGVDIDETHNKLTHQEDFLDQLTVHLEAVAGVSIDEETINLMKFQKAFEAGARLIGVAQEMSETIMAIKE